jgi:hypothetical protein
MRNFDFSPRESLFYENNDFLKVWPKVFGVEKSQSMGSLPKKTQNSKISRNGLEIHIPRSIKPLVKLL